MSTLPVIVKFDALFRSVSRLAIATALWLAVTGCSSRPAGIRTPDINPTKFAAAAIAQYDHDKDGIIDREELDSAPSLRSALGRIDTNKDREINADELATFAQQQWLDRGAGVIQLQCDVLLSGVPLDGATVTLEPEPFMGGAIHPATGVTSGGSALLEMAASDRPHPNARGVQNGLYLVRISKEVDGRETIPAKFNEQTTLGCEVAVRASYAPGPLVFDLAP